jgi:hypothetical protein
MIVRDPGDSRVTKWLYKGKVIGVDISDREIPVPAPFGSDRCVESRMFKKCFRRLTNLCFMCNRSQFELSVHLIFLSIDDCTGS